MDFAAFFTAIRPAYGRLNQGQVDGIIAIATEAQERRVPLKQLAYILATSRHESGHTMQPVEENLRYTSAERICAIWPSRFPTVASARPYVNNPEALAEKVYGGRDDLGNTQSGDGWLYRGRGTVQCTGRANYRRMGERLNLPLEQRPELALEPATSTRILFTGMLEGLFTGKRLGEYINSTTTGYVSARRVVNGTDRAKDIAAMADAFQAALEAGGYAVEPLEPEGPQKLAPGLYETPSGQLLEIGEHGFFVSAA